MAKYFTSKSTPAMRVIVNRQSETGLDMTLHGQVGDSEEGLDSKSLSALLAKNPTAPVTVRINSPGGSFFDGLALHNALGRHQGPTTAEVDGLCGSAATIVACGCQRVVMHENSQWFIHRANLVAIGNADAMRDALSWLEKADRLLADIYEARTGKGRAEILSAMRGKDGVDGTTFSPREAKVFGWCDEISWSPKRSAKPRAASASVSELRTQVQAARLRGLKQMAALR